MQSQTVELCVTFGKKEFDMMRFQANELNVKVTMMSPKAPQKPHKMFLGSFSDINIWPQEYLITLEPLYVKFPF